MVPPLSRSGCEKGGSAKRMRGGKENGLQANAGRKFPEIENARDRSPWRLNLDGLCSTTGAASLGYPSGEPAAFAAAPSSGCAGTVLSACAYSPALRLDRRPTSPARIGVASLSSTGGGYPTRIGCTALPIVRWRSIRLAPNDPSTG